MPASLSGRDTRDSQDTAHPAEPSGRTVCGRALRTRLEYPLERVCLSLLPAACPQFSAPYSAKRKFRAPRTQSLLFPAPTEFPTNESRASSAGRDRHPPPRKTPQTTKNHALLQTSAPPVPWPLRRAARDSAAPAGVQTAAERARDRSGAGRFSPAPASENETPSPLLWPPPRESPATAAHSTHAEIPQQITRNSF